jgi:hypothetical protein
MASSIVDSDRTFVGLLDRIVRRELYFRRCGSGQGGLLAIVPLERTCFVATPNVGGKRGSTVLLMQRKAGTSLGRDRYWLSLRIWTVESIPADETGRRRIQGGMTCMCLGIPLETVILSSLGVGVGRSRCVLGRNDSF